MARLEEIKEGRQVVGLSGTEPVTVIAVKWRGTGVMEVAFKDANGQLGSELLFREDEERLGVVEGALRWGFDGDAERMRLVSEAYRTHLAHLFDPYLAVYTSAIEPLPHQISAVYQEMLPRLPLRFVLADDPGAGKTIMTGLLLKELMIRGDLRRCLIVTPGSLAEQWQDELYHKFNLRFEILTNDRIQSSVSGNVFREAGFLIARLDKLARSDDLQQKLGDTDWDLVVVDEAHKMSATVWGGEVKYTKRYRLGQLLSRIARHYLLLTATPHNGKEEDFQLFMSLIDPDRFEGAVRASNRTVDVDDLMRRLVKEELVRFDGTPLFPERIAYTVNYDLSPLEERLYKAVTQYVQEEFNRADQLQGERRTTVGFALTILQRRLASSPEAIYQSLKRRRERLEDRLNEELAGKRALDAALHVYDEDLDEDDFPAAELEDMEERVIDQATAAQTISELRAELATLKNLEQMANEVRMSGEDRKWDELSKLLQDDVNMFGPDGMRKKLIIFTEHRDTLRYLNDRIRSLLGNDEAVVTIHGGLSRDERRKVQELFKHDKNVQILIATDAAGEGINLQRAHLMINYDLPWNPNRIEQRFGRIHRIGQREVCHLWNLVARETREGMVFQRLFEKLTQASNTLKGKVFDVLGKVTFENRPLRELLIEAVRYGNDPHVRERLYEVVDKSLDYEALRNLLAEHALTEESMDIQQVMAIREDMERMEAHRLQPHFVESFFLEAFTGLGGRIQPREKGRYEITFVPFVVRSRNVAVSSVEPVPNRYERVCFDKAYCIVPGKPEAALIAPGHPLLEAVIHVILEQEGDVLKRGAVFIDETDLSCEERLLFYVENAVQDGVILPSGSKRIVSKQVHFVELKEDGTAINAGYAPYLDYRAANAAELQAVKSYLKQRQWLKNDVEDIAVSYAVEEIIPAHLGEVRKRKLTLVEKTEKAVKERLRAEIQYWDFRAAELKEKEAAGKVNANLNSQMAERRAEEFAGRLKKRLAELEKEKRISALPPVVAGGALVIPKGLLSRLMGRTTQFSADAQSRKAIELKAMEAVMEIERELGYAPEDVSSQKVGYDVVSWVPAEKRGSEGSALRFIEVKGRTAGADTVTVTKNEILTAFNKPEQYILAIVEVDGDETNVVYLKKPFKERPDFAATSVNYNISELMKHADIILKRGNAIGLQEETDRGGAAS
ncbi:MAG: RNA helicase [Peptococcaceae bacterium 1109]|nr:MAG: RNA helicase [Peptococcaceae bacterium 1109]